MGKTKAFPLRLPSSLREDLDEFSKADGTSVNQFVVMAVAEKVGALKAVAFFEDCRKRADWAAFDRILSRKGGEPPRAGDEIPAELRGETGASRKKPAAKKKPAARKKA